MCVGCRGLPLWPPAVVVHCVGFGKTALTALSPAFLARCGPCVDAWLSQLTCAAHGGAYPAIAASQRHALRVACLLACDSMRAFWTDQPASQAASFVALDTPSGVVHSAVMQSDPQGRLTVNIHPRTPRHALVALCTSHVAHCVLPVWSGGARGWAWPAPCTALNDRLPLHCAEHMYTAAVPLQTRTEADLACDALCCAVRWLLLRCDTTVGKAVCCSRLWQVWLEYVCVVCWVCGGLSVGDAPHRLSCCVQRCYPACCGVYSVL